jgi:hypothetical protein
MPISTALRPHRETLISNLRQGRTDAAPEPFAGNIELLTKELYLPPAALRSSGWWLRING